MDVLAAHARIDNHLAAMDSSDPATPETANAQLAATLAYVGSINEALALSIRHVAPDPGQVENFTMPGGAIVDDIVDKLQKWIEQLLAKLTQIVKALGPTATFALAVGSTVTVTVTVGPFKESGASST